MTTEPANKKRKSCVTVVEAGKSMTLTEAWERMKEDGPDIYSSLDQYAEAMTGDEQLVLLQVASGRYYRDAAKENRYVVPRGLQGLGVERNSKSEIMKISDSKNDAVQGHQLTKVLSYGMWKEEGVDAIIYQVTIDGYLEALVIPGFVQLLEITPAAKKDFHEKVYQLATEKTTLALYATPRNVYDLLRLTGTTLGNAVTILKAFNSLAAKEDTKDLEIPKLGSVELLFTELDRDTCLRYRKSFLAAVLASTIATQSPAQRVATFVRIPSFTLAHQFEFRLPHSGPLFSKPGGHMAVKITLGSVPEGRSVLMSTNVLSMKDFQNISGNVVDYEVYVDSENLGAKRQGKVVPLVKKNVMDAELVKRMLSAIAEVNDQKESETRVMTVTNPPSNKEPTNFITLD